MTKSAQVWKTERWCTINLHCTLPVRWIWAHRESQVLATCWCTSSGRFVTHAHSQPFFSDADPLHPDGVLMFTIFGRELADKLCMLGFHTTVHHLHIGPYGIIGDNAW